MWGTIPWGDQDRGACKHVSIYTCTYIYIYIYSCIFKASCMAMAEARIWLGVAGMAFYWVTFNCWSVSSLLCSMSTLSRLVPSSSRSELDSSSQYWSIFADQHWNEPNAQACHILRCKTAPPCLQPPAIVPAPLFWEIHPKPCAVKLSNDEVSLSDCFLLSAVRLNKYKIAGVKASIRTCMQVRSEPIRYALPSSTRPEWLAHNYVIKPKAESQIYIYICMCIYI